MKPQILIWGSSAHARVVAEILALRGEFEIAGFIDDVYPDRKGKIFAGKDILGGREALTGALERGISHLIFGFGRSEEKLALAPQLAALGFRFVSAIHPGAHVARDVQVGCGTVIKAGAAIDSGVEIGEHAIIGSNVTVTHGSVLEDGARLAAGVTLGANVRVEGGAMVGIGAVIQSSVRIGAGALVGGGALVTYDVPPGMVVVGAPARVRREARPNDF